MILTTDKVKGNKKERKTKVVAVPCFGDDAEVILTEMTVAGYIRASNLQRKISEMDDIDETRRTGLLLCADLLSVMVDPESGEFLFKEDQLDYFHSVVDRVSLDNLLVGHGELNPAREVKPLEAKKKTS